MLSSKAFQSKEGHRYHFLSNLMIHWASDVSRDYVHLDVHSQPNKQHGDCSAHKAQRDSQICTMHLGHSRHLWYELGMPAGEKGCGVICHSCHMRCEWWLHAWQALHKALRSFTPSGMWTIVVNTSIAAITGAPHGLRLWARRAL